MVFHSAVHTDIGRLIETVFKHTCGFVLQIVQHTFVMPCITNIYSNQTVIAKGINPARSVFHVFFETFPIFQQWQNLRQSIAFQQISIQIVYPQTRIIPVFRLGILIELIVVDCIPVIFAPAIFLCSNFSFTCFAE